MAGISSSAITAAVPNAYKANGGTELGNSEWTDGSGLELYETTYRSFDAQIGRFMQADFLSGLMPMITPYRYALNNPVSWNDPSGLLEGNAKDASVLATVYIYMPYTVLGFSEWESFVDQRIQADGGGGGGGDNQNSSNISWNYGGGGGKKKGGGGKDNLKGGKQKDRDRSIKKYPSPFQKWYHREVKPYTNPGRDASDAELEEFYKEWLDLQKPTAKSVSVWTIIGVGLYEGVKWGAAAFFAPETGGTSLIMAAEIP